MGLGLGFLMCGDGGSAKEPEKYVLGGSQALSGPAYSVVIDTIVKGANLAVEKINQQGGNRRQKNGVNLHSQSEEFKKRESYVDLF